MLWKVFSHHIAPVAGNVKFELSEATKDAADDGQREENGNGMMFSIGGRRPLDGPNAFYNRILLVMHPFSGFGHQIVVAVQVQQAVPAEYGKRSLYLFSPMTY